MAYSVEITKRVVSYYSEEGCGEDDCDQSECRWLEGDFRLISDEGTEVEDFPCCDDPYDTPFYWAINLLEVEGLTEPSSYPIQGAAHEWLSGSFTDPYTGHVAETTARLTGDWTERQRADVFHAVSTVTYHDPKN